jgi:hypothetical protein
VAVRKLCENGEVGSWSIEKYKKLKNRNTFPKTCYGFFFKVIEKLKENFVILHKIFKEYMENILNIPQGKTKEELNVRKKIIKDFYAAWNAENPAKQIYNIYLQNFISVRFLSIQETSLIAALSYKSTLAVTYLTEILENAKAEQRVKPKQNNDNQKRFSEIIIMEYDKKDFGKIKLTVGVLKGSKQNIQYCITALENG